MSLTTFNLMYFKLHECVFHLYTVNIQYDIMICDPVTLGSGGVMVGLYHCFATS